MKGMHNMSFIWLCIAFIAGMFCGLYAAGVTFKW